MTRIQTDAHYFKNTQNSEVTPIQGKGGDQPTFQQPLLIVLEWNNVTEFVYKTHSIFIKDGTIEVQPYDEREEQTAEEIIQHYIDLEKIQRTEPKIQEILACNPNEYPIEKLTSQYI